MSEYADRDPRELEPHFSKHMSAMTAEKLHSKAAIAEELAYRDQEIERLTKILGRIEVLSASLSGSSHDEIYWLTRHAAEGTMPEQLSETTKDTSTCWPTKEQDERYARAVELVLSEKDTIKEYRDPLTGSLLNSVRDAAKGKR